MSTQIVTVRAAKSADIEPSGAERRIAPRFPSNLETTCNPIACRDTTPWPAQLVNISRGGLALAIGRRFEPGTLLALTLESADQSLSRSLLARVIHVRTQGQGLWVHGCRFSSELYDEDLAAFQAQRLPPVEPDNRSWTRFTCDVPTSCRRTQGGDRLPVRVVNISPNGVGLLAPSTIEVGSLLRLKLPGSRGHAARRVLIRVVQACNMSDSVCLLGCEFAQELNDQELQGLAR